MSDRNELAEAELQHEQQRHYMELILSLQKFNGKRVSHGIFNTVELYTLEKKWRVRKWLIKSCVADDVITDQYETTSLLTSGGIHQIALG